MTGAIAAWFDDVLACVAMEHPEAYAATERALAGRRFEISLDDEHFLLDLGTPSLHAPIVSVATDLDTLGALVEGELGVLDALLGGRFDVTAGPDDLVAVATASTHFLQGALRCVSTPALLDRLTVLRKERT